MKMFRCILLSILLTAIPAVALSGCITIVPSPQTFDPPDNSPSVTAPQQIGITPETRRVVINSFTIDPPHIESGASCIVNWDVSGATSVSIDNGIGNVGLTGHMGITPSATTSYTLTAGNASGTQTASARVVVNSASPVPAPTTLTSPSVTGLPVIQLFSADPDGIVAGESSTIEWIVYNSTSVTIEPAVYRQLGPISPAGSASVSPSATTSYILTAANAAGTCTATVTVTVNAAQAVYKNWEGTWNTNWGLMQLTQSAGKVTGSYEHDNGKIEGNISKNLTGDILVGTWSEEPSYTPPDDAGDLEFIMSSDLNSFTGNWRYGSSGSWSGWKGTRLTPKVLLDG